MSKLLPAPGRGSWRGAGEGDRGLGGAAMTRWHALAFPLNVKAAKWGLDRKVRWARMAEKGTAGAENRRRENVRQAVIRSCPIREYSHKKLTRRKA